MIPLRDNIPSRSTPFVSYAIVALSAVVFLMQLLEPADQATLVERLGMIPQRVSNPDEPVRIPTGEVRVVRIDGELRRAYETRPAAPSAVPPLLTLVTCIFLHGGWLHILGNMWFLYIFGDNVEDRFGHLGFAAFYLLCGTAASAAHLVTNANSPIPTIGASGAIAGVMGAYLVLYPRANVLTLVPLFFIFYTVVIPAPIFLGVWFVIQFFQGAMSVISVPAGGVAWWAHVGGFVIGAAGAFLLDRLDVLRPKVGQTLPNTRPGSYHPAHSYRRPWE